MIPTGLERLESLRVQLRTKVDEWSAGKITEDELYQWMLGEGAEPSTACNIIVAIKLLA